MSKKALVIKTKDLFQSPVTTDVALVSKPELLFSISPFLMDRAICENDENYLQIIPYITLVDNQTNEIFVYQRGKVGQENRLHEKYSLGLGGHIDIAPATQKQFKEVIAREAARELTEEVGLHDLTEQFKYKLDENLFGVFYSTLDSVARVHLCVSMFIYIDKATLADHEKNVIEHGQWLSFNDILDKRNNDELSFETWSNIIISIMREHIDDWNDLNDR